MLTARIDHLQITVFSELVLPVKLLNFKAERIENNLVNINWSTSTEVNNDYFTIERSSDAINWEPRETINGAGNSSANLNYSYNDENYLNSTTYYRLKQTDFNGDFEYSDIITVEPQNDYLTQINIYPNPSKGGLIHIKSN